MNPRLLYSKYLNELLQAFSSRIESFFSSSIYVRIVCVIMYVVLSGGLDRSGSDRQVRLIYRTLEFRNLIMTLWQECTIVGIISRGTLGT